MFQIGTRDLVPVREKAFGGKHRIQNRWENASYIVMEKPYPNLPAYKDRLSEHDDKPRDLDCNLLFPLISVQQKKPEHVQEESSMEDDHAICKPHMSETPAHILTNLPLQITLQVFISINKHRCKEEEVPGSSLSTIGSFSCNIRIIRINK